MLGAGLAYYTLPRALEFLIDIGGTDNFVTAFQPDKYFTLITYMMLAFGIGFEFPILLIFLQMAGIITPRQLSGAPPLRHRGDLRAGGGHHPVRRPDQHADALGPDDPLLRGRRS